MEVEKRDLNKGAEGKIGNGVSMSVEGKKDWERSKKLRCYIHVLISWDECDHCVPQTCTNKLFKKPFFLQKNFLTLKKECNFEFCVAGCLNAETRRLSREAWVSTRKLQWTLWS